MKIPQMLFILFFVIIPFQITTANLGIETDKIGEIRIIKPLKIVEQIKNGQANEANEKGRIIPKRFIQLKIGKSKSAKMEENKVSIEKKNLKFNLIFYSQFLNQKMN